MDRIRLTRYRKNKVEWVYGTEAAMESIIKGRMAKFSKKKRSTNLGNYVVCGKMLNEGDNFVEFVP